MVNRAKTGVRADPIMSRVPILATKLLAPPPRPGALSRPQLLARMDEGLAHGLTLISAPPGFGKTTLLSQWRAHCAGRGIPVAWLTLDEADGDPARFLRYLTSALDSLQPSLADDALNLLRTPRPAEGASVLTALINAISSTIDGDFALVIDDYERVDSAQVHEQLTFLLEHLPRPMHIFMATRLDPPLPLARLRARGNLLEIRTNDLRFDAAETAAFLGGVRGLDLSPPEVESLEQSVEGWVVGLRLAALALQGRQRDLKTLTAVFDGSHRYVVDYLASEVFERQPADLQGFLLKTAVLDRLNAQLCDALCDGGGREMLARLDEGNLFIDAIDDSRDNYRYHPLFAAFLRERLERDDPVTYREMQLRASRWHEGQGQFSEAVRYALAAGDVERAGDLLETSAPGLVRELEWSTLASWFSTLPEDALLSRPELALTVARALALTHRLDDAQGLLSSLEGIFDERGDLPGLGRVRSVGAFIAGRMDDQPEAIRLCSEALELLPEDDVAARSIVLWTLGTAHELGGDLRSASAAYLESTEVTRRAPGFAANWAAVVDLGYTQFEQGQLNQGARAFRQIIAASGPGGPAAPISGVAHSELGELEREWNHLDEAETHLDQAFAMLQSWGNILALLRTYRYRAKARMARGDFAGAIATIEEGEALARQNRVRWAGNLEAAKARFNVRAGNLEAAVAWARLSGLDNGDDVGHISHLKELEYLALADVLSGQRRYDEALRLLTRLEVAAADAGRGRNLVQISAQRSVALLQSGDGVEALAAAERVLRLAQHEGYVRTFVDQGPRMAELLSKILTRRHPPALERYIGTVLSSFTSARASSNGRSQRSLGPLSEREGEVLDLISSGLSNQEIADQIVVTEGTVKRHVHNIFRKLDVHSRTQAVARARELSLLPT